jgi:hypothetical protein
MVEFAYGVRRNRRPRKLASEVVFCFAALRSDVFSP